jgi:hypothetical protein
VVHACNHSYSGSRDQEARALKPAWANSSREKKVTKVGLVEWLKVEALSSSPSTTKKKKKTKPGVVMYAHPHKQEVKMGRLRLKTPGKKARFYLKNKQKQGLGAWFKW